MTQVFPAYDAPRNTGDAPALKGWLPAGALLAVTFLAGPFLGGLIKPVFILASLACGWLAWRKSPAAHFQTVLILIAFTPAARRVIDLSAGYDPGSLMLIGPMLALAAPALDIPKLFSASTARQLNFSPFVIYGLCLAYALSLTIMHGDWHNAAVDGIKYAVPLVYAIALYLRVDKASDILDVAASTFMVILPLTAIYGIYQYVNPPEWDKLWLMSAPITSAGYPEPFQVRVFSTMNGPASFATITAFGLFLVYFRQQTWLKIPVAILAALALMLTLYRTAWLGLAAPVLFCLLFAATRRKALFTIFLFVLAIILAIMFTPFGDVIADRLSTFTDTANDSSGRQRLEQFFILWSMPLGGLFGHGFSNVDTGVAGALAIDGMIAMSWFSMGIAVGMIHLATVIFLALRPVLASLVNPVPDAIVTGALAAGFLTQMPLATITSAEMGFLFWSIVVLGLLMHGPAQYRNPAGMMTG